MDPFLIRLKDIPLDDMVINVAEPPVPTQTQTKPAAFAAGFVCFAVVRKS